MPNPYHDPKNGQFTTKRGASGFSPSRGMGSDAKAVADRMQKNGTSKVFPQSRGSRVIANRSSRGVDLYAQTTSEYNARLAKNRVELSKKINREAGRTPKPKGWSANELKSAKGSDKRRDTFKGSNSLSGGTPVGWNQRNSITNKAAVARAAKYDSASPFYVTKNKTGKIKIKGSGEFSWMKQ